MGQKKRKSVNLQLKTHRGLEKFCLKIKWLEPFIGQPIGNSGNTVDGYGGGLIKTQMCGDHWRKRHDKLKLFLYDIMLWAKMKCAVEVYDEFARFISTNFIDPTGGLSA